MSEYSTNVVKCSNNKAYVVEVTLEPDEKTAQKDYVVSLDASTIEEISFTSSLNQLVLVGHVICVDQLGRIDKYIGMQECYCAVTIAEALKSTDGTFSNNDIDPDNMFMHRFIVNRICILERQASAIKYKIDLVSASWYNCAANISYSNYDKDPETIFSIIKTCLSLQELRADDDTFDKIKTDVKMNYATKLNDTLFTAVPYLLHKLFFLPSHDESMKFIYYDWFNMTYKILDLANPSSLATVEATILSFFKSNAEFYIQTEPTRIGAFNQTFGRINEYKNTFAKDMYAYDIEKNSFENKDITPKQVVQYMNSNMSYDGYVPKYHKIDIKGLTYVQSSSYWNAMLNVYNDSMRSIVENGSIVLEIAGNIKLQCASLVNVGIDRDMNALTSNSRDELEKMKVKYKTFEGPWIASSVNTIMRPQQKSFRQKIALFRNYMSEQKPPSKENAFLR